MNSLPRFLRTKEVARLCRVKVRTVEGWRRRGQGPEYTKLPTGQVLYPLPSTLEFIKSYTPLEDE